MCNKWTWIHGYPPGQCGEGHRNESKVYYTRSKLHYHTEQAKYIPYWHLTVYGQPGQTKWNIQRVRDSDTDTRQPLGGLGRHTRVGITLELSETGTRQFMGGLGRWELIPGSSWGWDTWTDDEVWWWGLTVLCMERRRELGGCLGGCQIDGPGSLDGASMACCYWKSGSILWGDILPESITGPQSLPFHVDLAEAISVSHCGPPSV